MNAPTSYLKAFQEYLKKIFDKNQKKKISNLDEVLKIYLQRAHVSYYELKLLIDDSNQKEISNLDEILKVLFKNTELAFKEDQVRLLIEKSIAKTPKAKIAILSSISKFSKENNPLSNNQENLLGILESELRQGISIFEFIKKNDIKFYIDPKDPYLEIEDVFFPEEKDRILYKDGKEYKLKDNDRMRLIQKTTG